MKLALVLYTYFCILQLARESNGEITPPWISSRGCYEWTPGSPSTQLTYNSPNNCFKECANLTHIGIRDDLCVCFANMPTTSRKPENFCHSPQHIHIYSKVIELPFNISQADYGYVYVSIQTNPSSMIFHASIDSSENHGIICIQDFSWNCDFRRGAANNVNGETAKNRCSLVSYFDLNNSCQRNDGDYWIGMYRETPMESSTNAPTVVFPSTQQISYVSDNTQETFSQTDPSIRSTIKLTPSPITVTSSAYLLTNVPTSLQYPEPASPNGEPEDIWKKMAIAFITISLALTIFIISGFAAYLRWKKGIHISHADGENNLIQGTDSSHTKKDERTYVDEDDVNLTGNTRTETKGKHAVPISALPFTGKREGGTFGNNERITDHIPDVFKKKKHRIHRTEVDDEGHDLERPTKERKRNEKDGTNISDTVVEHSRLDNAEDNNTNKKKEKKKKKKRKKKKSKSKKSKSYHANSSDATDGINVS